MKCYSYWTLEPCSGKNRIGDIRNTSIRGTWNSFSSLPTPLISEKVFWLGLKVEDSSLVKDVMGATVALQFGCL